MKKLFRIKNNNSMLGGVCLGLSEYLQVDVSLIRILFALSFFTPVPILIPYLIMWFIFPLKKVESIELLNY